MSRFLLIWLGLLTISLTFSGSAAATSPQIAGICESAARMAAEETGVPLDVLRAISLTETGRHSKGAFLPWPWTVNMEGVGKWFDTIVGAQNYVDRHFLKGARSFDIGCFQINYRWHGHAFNSIEDMFDPFTNARYAAEFLTGLHDEFGDWSRAAGAYHSRTPKYAKKYRKRFDQIRANLSTVPAAASKPEKQALVQKPRINTFPLLQSQGSLGGIASLVPLGIGGRKLIEIDTAREIIRPQP